MGAKRTLNETGTIEKNREKGTKYTTVGRDPVNGGNLDFFFRHAQPYKSGNAGSCGCKGSLVHACTAATSCNRKLHKDCCFKNGHDRASFLPDPRNAGISLSCYSAERTTMDPVSTIMANISTNRSAFSCGKHVGATQTGGNNKLNCFSLWNCRGLKSLTVPSKVPFIQDLLRGKSTFYCPNRDLVE